MRKLILSTLLSTIIVPTLALAQSSSEEGSEYIDVFGISVADHNFELPETRLDWLGVAEKIENGEVDSAVSFAMNEGNPPKDIFTAELMDKYQIEFEKYVLNKWYPNGEERAGSSDGSGEIPTPAELNAYYEQLLQDIASERAKKEQKNVVKD